MKSNLRICLLIGLIFSTILYTYYLISTFIAMIAVAGIMSGGETVSDALVNSAGVITLGIMFLMGVFGLLGLIFSSVSFTRVGVEPEVLAKKKGLPITVVVFNFILAFFIIIGLTEGVDFLSIICLLGFIASSVLIIVDIVRNKKLLNKQTNIPQQINQPEQEDANYQK